MSNGATTRSSLPPAPEAGGQPVEVRTILELTELAGGLAHELRNPLSTMMINLRLLAEDLQDDEAAVDDMRRRALLRVDTLSQEAERLQSLFDDFLHLTTRGQLHRRSVDLGGLLDRLARFLEPLARQQGVELVVDAPAEPVVAAVDEDLLGQALLNLALNGQQAMPEGGRLSLRLHADGEAVTLSVTDTGVGIAPGDVARVFRPFHSTKPGGTGLGLCIADRTARAHGGTLSFTSAPGVGTTFVVTLPGTTEADAAPEAADSIGTEDESRHE